MTIQYSASRQRQALELTDLRFKPPLERVGLLQWEKFDDIVLRGHAHGREVLLAQAPEALRLFRLHAG